MGKSKDLATGASYQDQTESDARYANVSGDTFTGTVTVTGSTNTNTTLNVVTPNWVSGAYADFNLGYQPISRKIRGSWIDGIEVYTNNANAALRVDASGRVTMPYQPAFSVTNSTNTFSSGTIVFNTAQVNVGGHYSTSNGRFTAPVAGNYYFIFATIVGNSGGFQVILQKNGSGVSGVGYCDTGSNDTGVVAKVISLSAGDYVTAYTSTGNIESAYSSFAGYLIG